MFSALFFAMAGLETVGAICLYVGLALVLGSAIQYYREGARLRKGKPSTRA